MDRVYSFDERPFDNVRDAALAIKSVSSGQRHIGVLHKDADQVYFLHLAWHHDLRNGIPQRDYSWVDPNLPAARLVHVAAICRKIWRANGKEIPYAFSEASECFDSETGIFDFGPNRLGLTCASFVIAVFGAAGLRLVELTTWPSDRADDVTWREHVISELHKSGDATAEHIEGISAPENWTVRVRPEEVAGAATTSPLPATFQIASELAKLLLTRLSRKSD